jgi:hypothetical protein
VKVRPPETATGTLLESVDPFPSSPLPPKPQQYAVPSLVSPHACATPVTSVTNWKPPDTGVGTELLAVVPFPSWPIPQQYAAPAAFKPQVNDPPAPIVVKVMPPETGTGLTLLVVDIVGWIVAFGPVESPQALDVAAMIAKETVQTLCRMVGAKYSLPLRFPHPEHEFVEISRLGTRRTRVDNIRDIASGELKLTSVRYDSLVVRIYGDVAVLQGIADNTSMFRGFPFSGKIRYTRVFVRRDGRWQAVAMQQTSMQ